MNIEQPEGHKPKKRIKLRTWAWILGILLLVCGIGLLASSPVGGIFSVLAGAILLPPASEFVANRWHIKITRNQRIAGAFICLIIMGAASAHSTPGDQGASTSTAATPSTSSAPQTPQQKLESEVTPQLENTSIQASLMDTSIQEENDPTRPKGADYVTIDVNTGEFWDDNSFITSTGELSSTLFQTVVPTDPNYYDVLIRYYGQTTDQYGNATSTMLMSYEIDRPLYNKINWSGISSVGNDIHLCAFLREVLDTMPQSQQNNSYVGCVVIPSDLRSAEDTIESSNPQYSDIPHYGT